MDTVRRFDQWMDDALYGPDGFYTTHGRAGRRGDFLTSPEVGPLFGAVLARMIDAEWIRLGRPEEFRVVEAGAGPGTLARSILAAEPEVARAGALEYVAVERSEAQRASHPTAIHSVAELPEHTEAGVILANELLDNLAFRLVVWDDRWREAYVERRDGRDVEILRLLPEPDGVLPRGGVPHGARAPLQHQAAEWVRDARASLGHGRLVVIDYVTARTAELAMRPWRQWLRTYAGHDRGQHYLAAAGRQDITTQVCLDQLVAAAGEPDTYRSQAQYLQYWGIDELVDQGRAWWEAKASAPDLMALRGRSRVREAEALLDPEGLGAFSVVEWAV
jgi:SAM-dependent MidA family methyltransferase